MGNFGSKPISIDVPDERLNFISEYDRLQTFNHWTRDYISKEKLARFGFYFERPVDVVKCIFCKVEIGNWDIGDDPLREHKRWSPQCPLIRNEPTDNIPIDQNILNESLSRSYDICGRQIENATSREINHPDYSSYSNRLETFVDWPKSVRQRPDDLADAGFFYLGKGDQVKCFACGGGLKDWEIDDIPWDEHALWYGEVCMYVKLTRGDEFVKKIKEKYALRRTKRDDETVEDQELKDKNQVSKVPDTDIEESMQVNNQYCKICYVNDVDTIFMPCMHVVACGRCALSMQNCPMCRKPIANRQRIYFS